jgi:ribosomal protein S7
MSNKLKKINKKIKYNTITGIKAKFTNVLMQKGKKTVSEKIVLNTTKFFLKNNSTKQVNFVDLVKSSLVNVSPCVNVILVRRGRKKVPMPYFLKKDLRLHFAVRLLTKISRQGSEHSIKKNLLKELQETSSVNSKSLASNKCLLAKKQLYQLAQINKSFTHYRWF